jgi:hypothetical protein
MFTSCKLELNQKCIDQYTTCFFHRQTANFLAKIWFGPDLRRKVQTQLELFEAQALSCPAQTMLDIRPSSEKPVIHN